MTAAIKVGDLVRIVDCRGVWLVIEMYMQDYYLVSNDTYQRALHKYELDKVPE